jgi:hypothetical protein
LGGFAVDVICVPAVTGEVSTATGAVTVYNLISTATFGAPGSPDFVERVIQASIAQ